MSPQRNLSNFIDTLLIAYILSENTEMQDIKNTIIDDYKILNERCGYVISKIRERKSKSLPPQEK
jgi:hypothetical protein